MRTSHLFFNSQIDLLTSGCWTKFYITDNGLRTSLTIHLADRYLVGDHDLLGLISAPIVDGVDEINSHHGALSTQVAY